MNTSNVALETANTLRFLPWIGQNYQTGFRGQRLLLLGESHYNEWVGEAHDLSREFTIECVKKVIARSNEVVDFWKYLEQMLLNEVRVGGWAPGGSGLWESVAFYNFVQEPISGGARVRPSDRAFKESKPFFRLVLEELRPTRIVVCGLRLWQQISAETDVKLTDFVQAYQLQVGLQCWCAATVHPSSGQYSWSRLHEPIKLFIESPDLVAEGDLPFGKAPA